MSLLGVCALGAVAAISAMLLREWKSGASATAVTVAAVCLITTVALTRYSEAIEGLLALAGEDGAVSDAASLALRALGVGFASQIGADICRDLGEGSVASCIESVGRAEMLLICLPELISFVENAVKMIG